MKPDAHKLRAIAADAERAAHALAAVCSHAESLALVLDQLDPTSSDAHRRQIFRAVAGAFRAGLGETARLQLASHLKL